MTPAEQVAERSRATRTSLLDVAAKLATVALLALIGVARGAEEAVDLSGDYVGSDFGCRMTFAQSGTSLLVSGICDSETSIHGTGSVDPISGAFTFSASVVGRLVSGMCSYDATGTGDGEVFSARFSSTGGDGFCPDVGLRGTKCGNGVIDLQEDCEDGNSLDGDCCSARCRAAPPGFACSDGNPCTHDACAGGLCRGTPKAAGAACSSDGFVCTDDVCDGGGHCTHVPNVSPCDDFRECTTGDVCSNGSCQQGTPLAAGTGCSSDSNVCTDDVCDGGGSCIYVPNVSPCDDFRECTTGDVCRDGSCQQGTPLAAGTVCSSDGNVCSTEVCDGAGGCTPTGVAPQCEGTIDVTGTWALSPPIPVPYSQVGFLQADAGSAVSQGTEWPNFQVDAVRFVQAGAVLSVQTASSPPDVALYPSRPGSVNPATGQFFVSFLAAPPESYASVIDIDGTASPLGDAFTAIARVSFFPLSGNTVEYNVTGLNRCRSDPCCGDGVVDPGEGCDGPCCDAACAVPLPAGCSSACGGTCDGAGNCAAGPCCGNGVVESGEACDGPCCDAACSAPLPPAPGPCARACNAGDCNGDGSAGIDELIYGVNIALGSASAHGCPVFDTNDDDRVTVDELIAAVTGALNGCGE